jgi:hypothetical protein
LQFEVIDDSLGIGETTMMTDFASERPDSKAKAPTRKSVYRVELVLVTHDARLDSRAVEDYLIDKVGDEGKILVADAQVEKVPSQVTAL